MSLYDQVRLAGDSSLYPYVCVVFCIPTCVVFAFIEFFLIVWCWVDIVIVWCWVNVSLHFTYLHILTYTVVLFFF